MAEWGGLKNKYAAQSLSMESLRKTLEDYKHNDAYRNPKTWMMDWELQILEALKPIEDRE